MSHTTLVITSISPPNAVLSDYASKCASYNMPFILIGDQSSPPDFSLKGCEFWSLDRQKTLPYKLAGIIPERHYARKNLGYLHAISGGATTIIETDDDNFAKESFWEPREVVKPAFKVDGTGWVNVYKYFSDVQIWPRGFPLEYIQKPLVPLETLRKESFCPIQQGLADENPDLDAIFRMTRPLPQSFSNGPDVTLGDRAWCPFNSQNTTWFRNAFPLLYLPSFCSFRMTDIWRSFIAQRIAWANGWRILFHKSTVWQERNEHSLLKDFKDEIPGYLNNASICSALENLVIVEGEENIGVNLLKCYELLISMGVVEVDELRLLNAWLEDLKSL